VEDGAAVLADVCAVLSNSQAGDAATILRTRYPFATSSKSGRKYSLKQYMTVFVRDGFVDRYSGRRLVFPGTMRLLARLLPGDFPFHKNWKTDACHFAFWQLFPTIDHVVSVARGGADDDSNWVSTSVLSNSAKANFTLEELGWTLRRPGNVAEWDGLTDWFLAQTRRDPAILGDDYLNRWHAAAQAVLGTKR
jgi:hypothetical protein